MSAKCTRLNTVKGRCKESTVISRCLRAWVSAYVTTCFCQVCARFGLFLPCMPHMLYVIYSCFLCNKMLRADKTSVIITNCQKSVYNVKRQISPDCTQNIKPPMAALLYWIRRNHTTQLKGCTWCWDPSRGKGWKPLWIKYTRSLYLQLQTYNAVHSAF